jgi:multidrug efflux pump subunit AcrA (membrane-fusion protein)
MDKIFASFLVASFLLAACAQATPTPPLPTPVVGPEAVVAEGHLMPRDDAWLAFAARGKVAEILVQKGEVVAEGQVLARLGDREPAEAQVAAAQLELAAAQADRLTAQNAHDTLTRAATLTHAQAWVKYLDAQAARAVAERAWEALDRDALKTDIQTAEADVKDKKQAWEDAQDEFNKYVDLDEDNPTRKTAKTALDDARDAYNEARRKQEELERRRDALEGGLDAAQGLEAETLYAYTNTAANVTSDAMMLAQARLAAAHLRVTAAEAQLAAAQLSLSNYDLKAPFAGTITDISLAAGELVGADKWVIQLADFSQWYVETSDLTELEVVKITEGQAVSLAPDALPDVELVGTVEAIALTSKLQSGDVLYTVKIRVEDVDPRLRWGMTIQATFEP